MFFYVYDAFALEPKHEGGLTRIENRIIELGINGRVEKLTPLRNLKSVIDTGIKSEAHTIVIVGGDETFLRSINIVAAHNIVLGYIPFATTSVCAPLLGISDTIEACNILSRRIVKPFDLAKANQNYFWACATIAHGSAVTIRCNDNFTISSRWPESQIRIDNLGNIFQSQLSRQHISPASRGTVTVDIQASQKNNRWFKKHSQKDHTEIVVQRVVINHCNQPVAVVLDQVTTIKTPVTITVKPKQLQLIVGKDRWI
ncbi:MAG: hypothetical protein HYV33_04695 [Candidatus Kerfeldbacteria bacterium]|nr:hypothetical protein [Candidatus Kerfeldbacteria bacterium]